MSKPCTTLLPGDGIGPEVSAAAVRVLDAAGAELEWERHIAGREALEKYGNPLPPEVLESIKRNRVALKGPITTQVGGGFKSINVQLRQELELYANLRPSRSLPSIPSRFEGVDIIVVRENTEDLYGDIVSDLCAGLVGGLGVVPGANIGLEAAVFEAVHGSAPDIAGKDLANPLALIRSGIMMLFHLGKDEAAERVRRALRHVVVTERIRTRDLGGE